MHQSCQMHADKRWRNNTCVMTQDAFLKGSWSGTSLAVQWLGLHTGGMGSVPSQGTKIPYASLKRVYFIAPYNSSEWGDGGVGGSSQPLPWPRLSPSHFLWGSLVPPRTELRANPELLPRCCWSCSQWPCWPWAQLKTQFLVRIRERVLRLCLGLGGSHCSEEACKEET